MQNDDSLSPRLFHPSDLKSLPPSTQQAYVGGSLRHPPPGVNGPNDPAVRRIRSSVEIQRFAEDEQDEDFSDIFGKEERVVEKTGSDSNSDRGTLMLNSKLSNNSWVRCCAMAGVLFSVGLTSKQLGDEDDEDDPFAELEEGFDEMGSCC